MASSENEKMIGLRSYPTEDSERTSMQLMLEHKDNFTKYWQQVALRAAAGQIDFICRHMGQDCERFPAIKVTGGLGMGMSVSLRKLAEQVFMNARIGNMKYQYMFGLPGTIQNYHYRPVIDYKSLCINGYPNCVQCPIGAVDIQCMANRKDKPSLFLRINKNYDW